MPDTCLAIHLDRMLRRIHLAPHNKAPDLNGERIGPGGAVTLLTLDETGPAPIHMLAERLVRDRSRMTRGLYQLEEKRLISRASAADDCRVGTISLTETGRHIVDVHQLALAETIDAALADLDEADRAAVTDLLARATP